MSSDTEADLLGSDDASGISLPSSFSDSKIEADLLGSDDVSGILLLSVQGTSCAPLSEKVQWSL